MFSSISNLFSGKKPAPESPMDSKLAVAALLVHLIDIDGDTTEKERSIVSQVLSKQFELGPSQVAQLIKTAHEKDHAAVDFYQFTTIITQLEMQQRIDIIAMMWQVVFADGHNHEMEDNMVWRVAELIGVSARDRTILRKKFSEQSSTGS